MDAEGDAGYLASFGLSYRASLTFCILVLRRRIALVQVVRNYEEVFASRENSAHYFVRMIIVQTKYKLLTYHPASTSGLPNRNNMCYDPRGAHPCSFDCHAVADFMNIITPVKLGNGID